VISKSSESTSRGRTNPSARLNMMVCKMPATVESHNWNLIRYFAEWLHNLLSRTQKAIDSGTLLYPMRTFNLYMGLAIIQVVAHSMTKCLNQTPDQLLCGNEVVANKHSGLMPYQVNLSISVCFFFSHLTLWDVQNVWLMYSWFSAWFQHHRKLVRKTMHFWIVQICHNKS
jgi:hypothetical protein